MGGAVGGLVRFDGTPNRDNPPRSSGLVTGTAGGPAGHFAEPFVPCSSNILDCFSKADFAYRAGSHWGRGSVGGPGTRQPRGTRSRFIPGRAETAQPGFPAGIDPLDTALSTPLTFLAEEIAPFTGDGTGGANASPAQSQRFAIFPQNGAIGGIGGEVVAIPVPTPTPTPTPTTTPPVIDTPVSAVPEPATWLQLLIGFAIVGTMLRWHRGRRGARQFS